jgi:predicted metalloprotease with PDZ domain
MRTYGVRYRTESTLVRPWLFLGIPAVVVRVPPGPAYYQSEGKLMRSGCLAPLAALLFAPTLAAQQVSYEVRFPNAVHHEAEVTLTLSGLPAGHPVELRMSRSSPGRYAVHEFAKNVYRVTATTASGTTLALTHPDPYGWTVPETDHDGTVMVHYTLYGDHADGTYDGIDTTHAHLNMPATFMWARGLDQRPIRVTFVPPTGWGWKVATQLLPTDRPFVFTAPNLQYFMDCPTELSDYTLRTWTVGSGPDTQQIRLAVHHAGTAADVDRFEELARRVVTAEEAVFGEFPRYEPGTYTFIADYLPWDFGDGMEHRNSTFISSRRTLHDNMTALLGTLSHEYFHSWNMERIRAREIEPFDFERADMSPELWFGEGFTNYYGKLALRRAGVWDDAAFAGGEGGALNYVITSPGRRFHSPNGMSELAPFVDAATTIDATNFANTFVSYYPYGEVLALGLDLTLRERFGKTLDDYMRLMWTRHGKTGIPYTEADLERALGDVTGDRAFAKDFFDRSVRGSDLPDFAALLAPAGLLLHPADSGAAFLGLVDLDYDSAGATIAANTLIGSPLYDAGLDRGDRIVTLDGRPLTADSVWQTVKAAHRPGDTIPVVYDSRGARKRASLTFVADPRFELLTNEQAGRPVTPAMRAFRARWLEGN